METITHTTFKTFLHRVAKARQLRELSPLHPHDLQHYCQTLINMASLFQLDNSMECSDRVDLFGDIDRTYTYRVAIQTFCREYLGLNLEFQGDPRGAPLKLIVDESLGDSFGDRTHLCVPCVDAYQSFV